MIPCSQDAVRNKKDNSVFIEQRILPLLEPRFVYPSTLLDLSFVLPIPFPRSFPSFYSLVFPTLKKFALFLVYSLSKHLISVSLFRMAFSLLSPAAGDHVTSRDHSSVLVLMVPPTVPLPPLLLLDIVSSFSWVTQREKGTLEDWKKASVAGA